MQNCNVYQVGIGSNFPARIIDDQGKGRVGVANDTRSSNNVSFAAFENYGKVGNCFTGSGTIIERDTNIESAVGRHAYKRSSRAECKVVK